MAQVSCQKEKKNIVVITSAALPTFLHIAPVFKTKNINKVEHFGNQHQKTVEYFITNHIFVQAFLQYR